jgi:hypothetical protein
MNDEGLADVEAANPFSFTPDFTQGSVLERHELGFRQGDGSNGRRNR